MCFCFYIAFYSKKNFKLQDHALGVERVGATKEQIKAAEFIGYGVKRLME